MVRISILYPNDNDVRFDFDYYTNVHMPRAIALLGKHPGFRGLVVERGTSGKTPGSAPAFIAMCHFRFTTVDAYFDAVSSGELRADIPNYTNAMPVIQINEIVIEEN